MRDTTKFTDYTAIRLVKVLLVLPPLVLTLERGTIQTVHLNNCECACLYSNVCDHRYLFVVCGLVIYPLYLTSALYILPRSLNTE